MKLSNPRTSTSGSSSSPGAIGGGDPLYAPDVLAARLWNIHTQRGEFRVTVGAETA